MTYPPKKDPDKIADNIVYLPIKLKRNSDISISNITTRYYQYQRKAADLNRKLKEKCCEKELQFLDIIPNIITG